MMLSFIKYLLIFAVLNVLVGGRLRTAISSFSKEVTFHDKRIILSASQATVTEQDSFVYAVCDSQEKTFKQNKCNITIETPLFNNATYKDICVVDLAPYNRKIDSLTKLHLYPFSDDIILLSWLVKNDDTLVTKAANVRVIRMPNCRINDISVPADKIHKIVTHIHEKSFDVILSNKTFCSSANCKVTYDLDGKKLTGPTKFLADVNFPHMSTAVAIKPPSPIAGLYVILWSGSHGFQLVQVGANGKGTELVKVDDSYVVKVSSAHGIFSACWATDRTNITCRQFDQKLKAMLNIVLGFLDNPGFSTVRWFQPHNLREGGLILVTGHVSGKGDRRFEGFSIIKIDADGHRSRPLEIEGLDFECTTIEQLVVNVSENDEDEFCFHFICDRGGYDQKGNWSALKFSSKCLPKLYVSMVKRHPSIIS